MPRALVDTTVLFAAAYSRDGAHDDGLEILHGIDTAGLPRGGCPRLCACRDAERTDDTRGPRVSCRLP